MLSSLSLGAVGDAMLFMSMTHSYREGIFKEGAERMDKEECW